MTTPTSDAPAQEERCQRHLYIFGGLVIGILARLVKPGADPMGWILTIVLGIAGAVFAGWLGREMGWYAAGQPAGFIGAILGAVAILALLRLVSGGKKG